MDQKNNSISWTTLLQVLALIIPVSFALFGVWWTNVTEIHKLEIVTAKELAVHEAAIAGNEKSIESLSSIEPRVSKNEADLAVFKERMSSLNDNMDRLANSIDKLNKSMNQGNYNGR